MKTIIVSIIILIHFQLGQKYSSLKLAEIGERLPTRMSIFTHIFYDHGEEKKEK
jgi:hypothetical protein